MSIEKSEVLLVEDDPAILKLTTRLLQSLKYTVHTAGNGTEALMVYGEQRDSIGVVLTDINMPDMGGSELAQKLRALDEQIPVVFVSGYDQERVIEESGLERIFFIQKPFSKAKLGSVVSTAFGVEV